MRPELEECGGGATGVILLRTSLPTEGWTSQHMQERVIRSSSPLVKININININNNSGGDTTTLLLIPN